MTGDIMHRAVDEESIAKQLQKQVVDKENEAKKHAARQLWLREPATQTFIQSLVKKRDALRKDIEELGSFCVIENLRAKTVEANTLTKVIEGTYES